MFPKRTFAKERSRVKVREGQRGKNVRQRTFAKGDGGGNVRERTFAKGDGRYNVCEGMFARGDLQCHCN